VFDYCTLCFVLIEKMLQQEINSKGKINGNFEKSTHFFFASYTTVTICVLIVLDLFKRLPSALPSSLCLSSLSFPVASRLP
jgi:hypothetical protein